MTDAHKNITGAIAALRSEKNLRRSWRLEIADILESFAPRATPPAQPAPASDEASTKGCDCGVMCQDLRDGCRYRPSEAPHGKPDGAVREAVRFVLHNDERERDYPIYETDDDRGLDECEYINFATDVIAALRSPKIAAAETSPGDIYSKQIERKMMDVADLIGDTLDQPSDPRAWDHLLVYAPRDVIERRLAAIDRIDVEAEAKSAEADEEKELFAAVTKIDLAGAVKHLRNWAAYKANEHCQEYANLIEAQARLIAWFVKERAIKAEAKSQEPDEAGQLSVREFREDAFRSMEVQICGDTRTVQFGVEDHGGDHPTMPCCAISWTDAADLASWVQSCIVHPTTKPEAPAISVGEIAKIIEEKIEFDLDLVSGSHTIYTEPAATAVAALIAGGR